MRALRELSRAAACIGFLASSATALQVGLGTPTSPQGMGPPNGFCWDAIPVAVPSVTAGTTEGGFMASYMPPCDTLNTSPGVWYSLVGTGGTITASLCDGPSTHDSRLTVYCTECEVDPLCVADNDSSCGNQARVSWCSQPGVDYLIVVHGVNEETGPFELVLTDDGAPCVPDVVCVDEFIGACCTGAGCDVLTEGECLAIGGTFQGHNTNCGVYTEVDCTSAFEDIAGTGTLFPAGNNSALLVPLDCEFDFYDDAKMTVVISSNGYLTFGSDGVDSSNNQIPNPNEPNDIICPRWDDLDPSAGGTIHYQTLGVPGSRRFIAQWTAVPENNTDRLSTFQAVLFEGDSAIEFRYGDISIESFPGDITVGIENADGTDGIAIDAGAIEDGDCRRIELVLVDDPCAAECWLLMGEALGPQAHDVGGHTFEALQISGLQGTWAVSMVDTPSFPVPRLLAADRLQLLHDGGQQPVPVCYLQVVMWNPYDFPANPEQQSRPLAVYAFGDGTLYTVPEGYRDGSLQWLAPEFTTTDGVEHVAFPFQIDW